MSYLTQDRIASNHSMIVRVAQSAAQEGIHDNPDGWAMDRRRIWASSPGWDAAWESAEASAPNADHGANEAVITDGMILASVQQLIAAEAPPA